MKTNILSLLAIAGLLSFSGCASDDTANKQTEHEPGTEGLTSFVEDDPATRTTAEYDGSGLNFFWTAGDRLWVNTGTAISPVLTQDSKNNISDLLLPNPAIPTGVKRAAKAKFYFSGTFTASSYPVRYTGKNGTADKVTIKASQTQSVPNDASHIGEDGDCGIATASKPAGENRYHFTLDHKAAYITFMPYTTLGVVAGAKIQKIRVFTGNTSDALAGTFDLADDGTLSNPTSTSNSIELTVNNFSIPSTETYATNAATMVVNPGTYSNVSIEYTLHDPVSNVTGTITKTYPSVTFTAGRNKKVKTDLQVREILYYMWDAQQSYWYGHTRPNGEPDGNYPKDGTTAPDRWRNEIIGYNDPTGTAPAVLPSHSATGCPNANELLWYCFQGEPHWDSNELWATGGHLYSGGMWFKKKSNISGYSAAMAPDGVDYTRTTSLPSQLVSYNVINHKPSNLSAYFFFPATGMYNDGNLWDAQSGGLYWASTPWPNSNVSYAMYIGSGGNYIQIGGYHRVFGGQVWSAQ